VPNLPAESVIDSEYVPALGFGRRPVPEARRQRQPEVRTAVRRGAMSAGSGMQRGDPNTRTAHLRRLEIRAA
jgi:hypothetical protein